MPWAIVKTCSPVPSAVCGKRGYAHTTARDIVAASDTNLASIGYHYGSTRALLNAAVLAAMDDFGAEMARAIGEPDPGQSALERFRAVLDPGHRLVPGQQPGVARHLRHLHRGAARR
jgi:AcrR family transcriptional regulator